MMKILNNIWPFSEIAMYKEANEILHKKFDKLHATVAAGNHWNGAGGAPVHMPELKEFLLRSLEKEFTPVLRDEMMRIFFEIAQYIDVDVSAAYNRSQDVFAFRYNIPSLSRIIHLANPAPLPYKEK